MPGDVFNYTPQTSSAPWQDFLPMEDILAIDSSTLGMSQRDAILLKVRARALRRRAEILRTPSIDVDEQRRLLKAEQAQLR